MSNKDRVCCMCGIMVNPLMGFSPTVFFTKKGKRKGKEFVFCADDWELVLLSVNDDLVEVLAGAKRS